MKKSTVFEHKWALITGASSGIGKAIAYELASRKANLLLISRTEIVLNQVKSDLEKVFGIQVVCFPTDLSQNNVAGKIYEFCQDKNIQISIVVNNAGYALQTSEEIRFPEKVVSMIHVLINNTVDLSYRMLPGMIQRKEGYILNISSIVALFPVASTLTYHAAKTFLLAFTRVLHWEYAKDGIHITCSLPGATKTGFSKASDLFVPEHLLKRYGSADFVAKASIEALVKNKITVIPGWNNKLMFWLSCLIPHYWIYLGQKKYWTRYR